MELIEIKNVSETAYRFSSVLKFLPGETVTVTKEDVESKPTIKALIKGGHLKVVGAKNEPKTKKEVIEEV